MDTGHAGITYHKSNASLRDPDIQIFGRLNAPNVPGLKPDEGYLTMPGLLKPKSRGTVWLASTDLAAVPLVDPNYFADPADVDAYVASVELAMAIGNGKGFDGMRKDQVRIPGAKRTEIVDYIRANAATYFHFVGTSAMGKEASAPVDGSLRVRGVGPAARRRRLGHAGEHLLQHQCADDRARRAGSQNRAGVGPGGDAAAEVTGTRSGLVPSAASRYIAAHDDDDRCQQLAPPPFRHTGARLNFVVPPEKGPRHVFPSDAPRWLP